ncbi:hypothetical protein IWW38_000444 [Coemansia aciculifera]|uniref:Uncharacterized protein n=1 Tax=Coemansia aciculifera TaxID=417176 RepID=A0ACC1M9T8_9FUNG|nr:hypothetical protein IWW38_000444 [Coemansia aciculifera]
MYKEVLAPLVFVGARWRTAVLVSICDSCSLKYNYYSKSIELSFPAWPVGLSCPSADKYSLVKYVVIKATTWADARSGSFSETFDKPQYEDLVFPSATTLELHLGKPLHDIQHKELEAAKEKAASFAGSLPRLVPAATNVEVSRMDRVCISRAARYSYMKPLAGRQAPSIQLQVYSILKTAVALEFWDDTTDYAILGALATAPATTILQRLDIGNMALGAVHIIQKVAQLGITERTLTMTTSLLPPPLPVVLTTPQLNLLKSGGKVYSKPKFLTLCLYCGYLTRRLPAVVCIPNHEIYTEWKGMHQQLSRKTLNSHVLRPERTTAFAIRKPYSPKWWGV